MGSADRHHWLRGDLTAAESWDSGFTSRRAATTDTSTTDGQGEDQPGDGTSDGEFGGHRVGRGGGSRLLTTRSHCPFANAASIQVAILDASSRPGLLSDGPRADSRSATITGRGAVKAASMRWRITSASGSPRLPRSGAVCRASEG